MTIKKTFKSLTALMLCVIMVAAMMPAFASAKLAAPKLKKAAVHGEGIRVTWESVDGAVSYKVYRKTAKTDWEQVASVEKTSYQDNSVKAGKTYTYTVRAVDAGGTAGARDKSGVSAKMASGATKTEDLKQKETATEETATTETIAVTAPEQRDDEVEDEDDANSAAETPKLVKPVNKTNGVLVKWKSAAGAAGYIVYRKTASAKKFKKLKSVNDASATSYLDTSAASGSTYVYTVRAVDSTGAKSGCNTKGKKITFYEAPTIKKVKSVKTGVQVKWGAVAGATYYAVLRRADGTTKWKRLAVTRSTTYVDSGAVLGVKYWYTIRVVTAGKKKLSDIITPGKSCAYVGHAVIKSLKSKDGYTSATTGVHHAAYVEVSWDPVPGAAAYRVFHKTGEGKWIVLGSTTGTTFKDYTAVNNTKYVYRIRALDSSNKYVGSYDKTGKTITHYVAPTMTNCVRSGDNLLTTWEPVEGASHYQVYRKIVAGGTWIKLAQTTSTSYTDSTMPSGTRCWYTVAVCASDGTLLSTHDPDGVNNTSYVDRPILISAVSSVGGVTFSWQRVDLAERYHIYRKNGERSAWIDLGTSTTNSYFDATAVNGTKYYYTVAVRDAADTQDLSLYNETGVSVTYYEAPKLKSLENTSSGAKFTWGKVDGIGTYKVYRRTGSQEWTAIATVTTTQYVDASVLSTGHYSYTVKCVLNGNEISAYRTPGLDTVFYWNPVIQSGPSLSSGSIVFSWSAIDGINTYRVQRKVDDGSWTTIATVSALSYTDSAVTSGSTYTYRVYCVTGGAVVSGAGSTSAFKYLKTPVVKIFSLTVGLKLEWDTVKGSDGYLIYRKQNGGSYSLLKTISGGSANSFTDKNVTGATVYYYQVQATSGSSRSGLSAEVSATAK